MVPSRGSRVALVRQHWVFAVVLGCATALRAVVQLAYQPALIFPDSERYLRYAHQFIAGHWSPDWLRTSGYSLLLIPAVLVRNLTVIAAVQHLLGLATAVLVYAVVVHFGARRWLAVLATVPVLFDALQLDIEQYVLTDVSATFLLLAALVVLVWKRDAIGRAALIGAGLLLAAATIIRESDLLVMFPMLLYLAVVIRPRRRLATQAALLLAGVLLPVLGYLGWYQVSTGQFGFTSYNSQFMYGRIAQFADCTGVSLPWYEQPLCPRQPPAQRDPDFYMWSPRSPQVILKVPPGMNGGHIIPDFDRRIIQHQPLTYLKVVVGDVLYSFSPVRGGRAGALPELVPPVPPVLPGQQAGRAEYGPCLQRQQRPRPARARRFPDRLRPVLPHPWPAARRRSRVGRGRPGRDRPGAPQRAARPLPAVHGRRHRRGGAPVHHHDV